MDNEFELDAEDNLDLDEDEEDLSDLELDD